MDPSRFSKQQQSQPSQPQHHLLLHSAIMNDATPQHVLAEARKNLQLLIDSGISKDVLHQWVENSQSLQLAFPGQAVTNALPSSPQCPPPPPPQSLPPSNTSSTPQIKHEMVPENLPTAWTPASAHLMTPMTDNDGHMYMPSTMTFSQQHRPRISVSSTSSGSSGHASIWSNNSTLAGEQSKSSIQQLEGQNQRSHSLGMKKGSPPTISRIIVAGTLSQ